MSTLDGKTADHIANEALRAEIARMAGVIDKFEADRAKRENDEMVSKVDSMNKRKAEEAAAAEAKRLEVAALNIPRPETLAAYRAMPLKLKNLLIQQFSSDFPALLSQKEKAQCSWLEWDRLQKQVKK